MESTISEQIGEELNRNFFEGLFDVLNKGMRTSYLIAY